MKLKKYSPLIGGTIGLIIGIILFFMECWSLFNCPEGAFCGNPYFCVQRIFAATVVLAIVGVIFGLIIKKSKKTS